MNINGKCKSGRKFLRKNNGVKMLLKDSENIYKQTTNPLDREKTVMNLFHQHFMQEFFQAGRVIQAGFMCQSLFHFF